MFSRISRLDLFIALMYAVVFTAFTGSFASPAWSFDYDEYRECIEREWATYATTDGTIDCRLV